MRLNRLFAALLLASAISTGAQSTNVQTKLVTLADCIQMALAHNLDVKIQRYGPEVARYQVSLSYGAYDPGFLVSGTHSFDADPGGRDQQGRPYTGRSSDANSFNTGFNGLLPSGLTYTIGGSISDNYGETPVTVSNQTVRLPFETTSGNMGFMELRQPLLKGFWIDDTRYGIAVSKNRVKWSELGFRLQIMRTVQAVEVTYYTLIAARENVKNWEKAVLTSERFLAETRKRIEVGQLAPLEDKRAESQLAQNRSQLIAAINTLAKQQNALKQLLTDDFAGMYATELSPSESLVAVPQHLDVQESWQRGLTQRPDLLQSKLDLEQQGITIKYQKNQLFPQLDLVGSYGWRASGQEYSDALDGLRQGNSPNYTYGAELRIPLGNRRAREGYKIAKADLQQLLLSHKKLEQMIMAEIDNGTKDALSAYERIESTRQAREFAEKALEAKEKMMENGKATSFEVLELQRDLTIARTSELEALANQIISLANLAFSEGAILERNRLVLELK